LFFQAFHLDQKHRGGVARVARVRGVLDGLKRDLVHHLQGRRSDGARGDFCNGLGRVVH